MRRFRSLLRVCVAAATLACAAAAASGAQAAASPSTTFKLPPVRHVFVIVLENQGYAATFGNPAADPYLAQTLPAEGALLENYYATGHESNDNYVSLISGQPPNAQNQADCPRFDNFRAR
jgi:phosphatidylinositol-3-phosphatase